jgi:hypothetical protein
VASIGSRRSSAAVSADAPGAPEPAEQVVVAVPLAAAVERYQQQVRPLEIRQRRGGPGQAEDRVAQRPAHALQELALGAQPRGPERRLAPAGEYQPGAARHVIGQHRQRGPAFGVAQDVHVVKDQHHRRGHRREG